MNLRRIPADRMAGIFGNRLVRVASLATAGVALAVAAGAVAHATSGYVVTASPDLLVRSGPGTGYPAVGRVGHGVALDISCQVKSGSFVGGSDVWDRISSGYVSDYWVSTPAFNAFSSGIARCDNSGRSPVGAASAQGTVQSHGIPVNLRAAPSTSAPFAGSEPDGAKVTIVCTSRGDTVNGNWGPTSLWDKLDVGSFISDGFVFTGTNNPVAPDCGGGQTQGSNGSPYGDMPHGLSLHGFDFGQCTAYVAWRLDRAGVSVNYGAFPSDWNANKWADHARHLGFRVDNTPEVGAVAQLTSGPYGHVAVVYQVNSNGSVMVEDYNWNYNQSYSRHLMAHVDNFIHFH